jgi:hypothetical protein
VAKRIIIVTVAIAIVVAAVWVYSQHDLASKLAQADEWTAIQQTNAIIQSGPKVDDWPLRGFIPTSTLQSAAATLEGVELVVPVGTFKDGHVDGHLHFAIQSASINPGNAFVGIRLDTVVTYAPDREAPWWKNARAHILLDAILLPASPTQDGDVILNRFRIEPDSIKLSAGFANFDIRILWGLASVLSADEVALRLRDALALSVPSLSPSFELAASVTSTSFQPFGGVEVPHSGTNLTVTMNRVSKTFKLVTFDQWLLTNSGVWLLGGRQVPPIAAGPPPSASEISSQRQALDAKLTPFQQSDAAIELTIPGTALTDFIDDLMQPSPLDATVTTSKTTGNVTDAIVIHNDKVLGNVGLEVRPDGDSFAKADIAISPGKSSWSASSGVALPLSLKATADIKLNIHLATGVGGGIGSPPLDLDGVLDVPSLAVHAVVEQKEVPQGSAIVLQPSIPCAPVVLRVNPGAAPPIATDWIVVSPIGLGLDREIGGMKIAPGVLIDGLPIILNSSSLTNPSGKPSSPADPSKTAVHFPKPFLSAALSPAGVSMDDTGVTIRANAVLSTRDDAETDAEKAKRKDLRQALKDASPELTCESKSSLKVIDGPITLVDLYREYVYIGQSLKNHIGVATDILKALTDIDPRNTPQNLMKLADAVGNATNYDAQHLWDTIVNPPGPSVSTGGVTVTAGAGGVSVSGTAGGTPIDIGPTHARVGGVCLGFGCK